MKELEHEKDFYEAVNFTHRLHSEMSLFSGGCSICHHYNPPGDIVKCKYCHEKERKRGNISKPDLKAAYHRQCINCHSSWEQKTECESCHLLKSHIRDSRSEQQPLTEGHPKLTKPEKIVYETDSDEGKIVTFRHNEHTNIFNLECTDCHSSESCIKCHNKKETGEITITDVSHDKCSDCHDTDDSCGKCHKNKESGPFNHLQSTGFNLAKHHSTVACISCHKKEKDFSGLNKSCSSCHNWDSENFDHSVTGLKLDSTHSEFDCADCHMDNNYNAAPSCSDCHDEISYPKNLPGKRIK
jgi:hypothetical protein